MLDMTCANNQNNSGGMATINSNFSGVFPTQKQLRGRHDIERSRRTKRFDDDRARRSRRHPT